MLAESDQYLIASKDESLWARIDGHVSAVTNPTELDKIWNAIAGAWFEDQNDPALVLLKLDLEEASIWASTDSAFVFGWEIAKAHAKDEEPDVGTHEVLAF